MAAQEVRLYAAGSLRGALTELGQVFQRETGVAVEGTFGASGLLRERIEQGEPAEVFASANMEHPRALEKAGRGGPVRLFARNQLCALVRRRRQHGGERDGGKPRFHFAFGKKSCSPPIL